MPQRVPERVRPITPQLAWRVAVLGGIAFVLFGIVFFRLWYLQVLTGQDSRTVASQNRLRKVPIEAPRGDIVDRTGQKLVTTRPAAVIQLVPSTLPQSVRDEAEQYRIAVSAAEAERLRSGAGRRLRAPVARRRQEEHQGRGARSARAPAQGQAARKVAVPAAPANEMKLLDLYRRIGDVIGISVKTIHERVIRGIADAPYSNITIRTDVPPEQFNYMQERPEYFKGIVVARRYVREYPHNDSRRSCSGRSREIHDDQVGTTHFKGATAGTRVGQSGLEYEYDKYLRGEDGYSKVVVNASGSRDDERRVSVKQPAQGSRLKLTLDMGLEKVGDAAAQAGDGELRVPGARRRLRGDGSVQWRDPRDGLRAELQREHLRPADLGVHLQVPDVNSTDAPLLNRATDSAYPTGSTFKPVTAMAALESH